MMAQSTLSTPLELSSMSPAYADYVNPEWVRLLDLLGMNVRYRSCRGTELHAEDGRIFLDFLSGYCVHTTPATIIPLSSRPCATSFRRAGQRCCKATLPTSPASSRSGYVVVRADA